MSTNLTNIDCLYTLVDKGGESMNTNSNITIMDQVKELLNQKEIGKAILLKDVINIFDNKHSDIKRIRSTISTYLNRLVQSDELKKFDNGIFYKATKNVFGETPIDVRDLLRQLYFFDANKRVGYRIGANVLSNIGITNNIENSINIVTNNLNQKKILESINQPIRLMKPVTKVNDDNYLYLQLLDTIRIIDRYHLNNKSVGKKIASYMVKNNIEIDRLFQFAKKYYNKKTMSNLIDLLSSE